jgi:hypothetical protein
LRSRLSDASARGGCSSANERAVRHVPGCRAAPLIAAAVLLAFWLPLFPETIYRFFVRVMLLPGWTEIVLANALSGLFFVVYWIGVFDSLAICVVPREERYLDLLLAKPLQRGAYLLARLLPALLMMAVLGAGGAAATWLAMAAAGWDYDAWTFAGSNAATIAWAVMLVALVNVLILATRDSYTALLIAFVPAFVSIFPGFILVYRPDLYADRPLLRDIAVFPMNLVWYPGIARASGIAIAAALLVLAALLAVIAGWRFSRKDVA